MNFKHEREEYKNKFHDAMRRCEKLGAEIIFKPLGKYDVVNKNNNRIIHLQDASSIDEILHWLDTVK